MRVYLGKCSRDDLRTARQTAPSHVYGHCWTPGRRGFEHVPFIVDNGAFTGSFEPEQWLNLLDALAEYTYKPDFVVLPDHYNDAEKTIENHRKWADEVLQRDLTPAFVLQPGLDEEMQINLAARLGAEFVFVGGETRWKRAYGSEIVQMAHKNDLKVHIGNPSGPEGLAWAYRIDADSADTSSVTQSQAWHYLEKLEKVTLKEGVLKNDSRQATLTGGGIS